MRLFTLLALLLAPAPSASPADRHASPAPAAAPLSPDELFSRRALRRARLLIEMRLLEYRSDRLECVRRAILTQLPPDLRPVEPPTIRQAENPAASACDFFSLRE